MQATKSSRAKKRFAEMYPVKKWLSVNEACSYLDICVTNLKELVLKNGLSVHALKGKLYYKVSELDSLIEENPVIRKVS